MIFNEIYGIYYHTVAAVLSAAVDHPLKAHELDEIVAEKGFGESAMEIIPALENERWQLLRKDGTMPLRHKPTLPLTTLEKAWLNAVAADPRIRLFTDDPPCFPGVPPLYQAGDVCIFDKYSDGDPYENPGYIRNFRRILDAVKNEYPLSITMRNRLGGVSRKVILPEFLEYSEKDDKFRVTGRGRHRRSVINLGRIVQCGRYEAEFYPLGGGQKEPPMDRVTFELTDERKALERVMMHFAHFAKEAEKIGENRYRVSILYDRHDVSEMVIRLLSFGSLVEVTGPEDFVQRMRKRLTDQKSCGL